MQTTTTFDKYQSTALKGIAILMMLMHHNFRKIDLFENYDVSFFPFSGDFIVSVSLFFKICVSLFVFISGYGLYLSYNDKTVCTNNWAAGRWAKLMSGYWAIFIIALIVSHFLDHRPESIYFQKGSTIGIFNLLLDFFGLPNLFESPTLNSTWWYMSIAVFFIFTLPVFVKSEKSFGPFALLFLSVGIPRIFQIKYTDNSYVTFCYTFILGIIFAKYNLVDRWVNYRHGPHILLSKTIRFVAELLLIIAGFHIYLRLPSKNFWEVKFGIIPVIIILFCCEFILTIPIIKSIFYYLGAHSMNIFLIHTFIRGIYLADFTYSFHHFALITLILLMISLLLSIILEFIKHLIKYDKIAGQFTDFISREHKNITHGN